MNTETMIMELKAVAEKHRNDKRFTFDTNITAMCEDIIPKLKQLAEYEAIGTVKECRAAVEKTESKSHKKDTGWISCSERLPECEEGAEVGPVLYKSKDTGIIMAGYYGRGGKYRDSYFRTYTDLTDGVDSRDIIAWQPLPEPYIPEGGGTP